MGKKSKNNLKGRENRPEPKFAHVPARELFDQNTRTPGRWAFCSLPFSFAPFLLLLRSPFQTPAGDPPAANRATPATVDYHISSSTKHFFWPKFLELCKIACELLQVSFYNAKISILRNVSCVPFVYDL